MSESTAPVDLVVIGGGIVGLATAREALIRRPDWRVLVLEKEPQIAAHQSGHNSGVLHAGIYYKPGSVKARASAEGRRLLIDYCAEKGIPARLCGKLIVALDESELSRLEDLYQRGIANDVPGLERIGPERIHEIEPHAAGIAGVWSPGTGIVDYVRVAHAYADDIRAGGGEVLTGQRVESIREVGDEIIVISHSGLEVAARQVIACAGLQGDRVARLSGVEASMQIVPFRGDYYALTPEARPLVNGLIYPVPDPRFPFLGVHFTRTIHDEVWAGPNAVLAFAREGYRRTDLNLRDLWEVVRFPGFWRMASKFWRTGLMEMWRDTIKAAYVREMQKYVPDVRPSDVISGHSGVRAQALNADGTFVDDFVIARRGRVTHVQNAPSPGATSSMVIARMIMERAVLEGD
jgi:L-2-hydroxyglutarate oxidase LhgO